MEYERLQEEELDRMVAEGEIGPNQRARVRFIRWLSKEEYAERKMAEVDGPGRKRSQRPTPTQGSGALGTTAPVRHADTTRGSSSTRTWALSEL